MLRFRIVKKEGIEFRQALLFHFIQAVSRNTGLPKWEDQQVSEKACQTLFSVILICIIMVKMTLVLHLLEGGNFWNDSFQASFMALLQNKDSSLLQYKRGDEVVTALVLKAFPDCTSD